MLRRLFLWCLCLLLALPCAGLAQEETALRWLGVEDEKPASAPFEAHFINVGTADCFLLRQGEHTLLMDCGHLDKAVRVLDYFDALGIDRLEYAMYTHPHNDHIGGFLAVLDTIEVGTFLVPETFEDFSSEQHNLLMALLEEKDIAVQTIGHGDTIPFGDAVLTGYQWQQPSEAVNDRSMMLHARYGERAILFAADVENRGQKALAEQVGDALKADILKMPHHGLADYMRELHAVVKPELATISNVRGESIERRLTQLEQRNIDWLLTTKGTLCAFTDGQTWTLWQIPRQTTK